MPNQKHKWNFSDHNVESYVQTSRLDKVYIKNYTWIASISTVNSLQ